MNQRAHAIGFALARGLAYGAAAILALFALVWIVFALLMTAMGPMFGSGLGFLLAIAGLLPAGAAWFLFDRARTATSDD
jgi:hypothetical protein